MQGAPNVLSSDEVTKGERDVLSHMNVLIEDTLIAEFNRLSQGLGARRRGSLPTAVWMRTARPVVLVLSWLGLWAGLLSGSESRTDTILMIDDHEILYRSGTQRRLHCPTRCKEGPLISNERLWEAEIGYCSVHRDAGTGRYQMWYQAYAGQRARSPAERVVVCYAESVDGIHWERPELTLHPFNGIRKTNIVLTGNGGTSVLYCTAVLYDRREQDPSRRYKMAYWDFAVDGGREYPGLCVAFSPDGIHWSKHDRAPLLRGSYGTAAPAPYSDEREARPWDRPGSISDVIDLMWDPVRNAFAIYCKTWVDGPDGRMYWKRAAARTQSRDFLHWSCPQLILAADELERPQGGEARGVQIHGAPVFYHAGVYFALLQVLDLAGTGTMPAELAVSRDGIRFARPFRDTYFLPVRGDGSTFDAGCLWTNAMPVFLEDEIRFYYGAYSAWNPADGNGASGVGLSILPRDRFAGLLPIERIGQVTLKPRTFDGVASISINADASRGSVRVELLTEDGYRIRGFTRGDATPIRGDGLRHLVAWREKSATDLPPGRYCMRIYLDQAELFSVELTQDGEGGGLKNGGANR